MKNLIKTIILSLVAMVGSSVAVVAEPVEIIDILGRKVQLERPANRIVLAQGRHIQALSLIHPDPVSLIAGWKEDFKLDSASFAVWQEKFPAVNDIPAVGIAADMSFSLEKTISLNPDVVVMGSIVSTLTDEANFKQLTAQFDAAGIPVVFVDFFVSPLDNTLPSMEILGRLIGREAQAAAFSDFYNSKIRRIEDVITQEIKRPDVFMHVHASAYDCCASPGKGVFHDFIEAAGGHNIGADVIPGVAGRISLEYLISKNPDFYVATGGSHMIGKGGMVLGTGIGPADAAKSLSQLVAAPGLADLSAVADKRAFGIWHLFNDSPTHILAVEALAKWFHPELFVDIDPQATLDELNERFLSVPLQGTYWTATE